MEEKEKKEKTAWERRSHDRSPDQAQMNISIDKVTLKLLDEAANKSGRTRSNMVRFVLRRALGPSSETF